MSNTILFLSLNLYICYNLDSKVSVIFMKSKNELVKMLLNNKQIEVENYDDLLEMLINESIAVDTDKEEKISFGEKVADKITAVAGSWTFIIFFTIFLILWIILNIYAFENVDPYPFILLNLVLSCIASLQAPIIMMSQNRQAKKDSLRSRNDYKTDLKSELILEELHDKITAIEKNQKKILEYIQSKDQEKKN